MRARAAIETARCLQLNASMSGPYPPHYASYAPPDRPSDAPVALEAPRYPHGYPDTNRIPRGFAAIAARMRASWLGVSAYLAAGVALGLVLIVALSVGGDGASAGRAAAKDSVDDNIVRLTSADVSGGCWQGSNGGPLRVTVSLEVGLDGKVRNAAANGAAESMRGCVEAHVRTWEFLPQATATTMVLPFEITR